MYKVKFYHHMAVPCRSIEETLPFYQDVLGMQVVATIGDASGDDKYSQIWYDKSGGPIDDIEKHHITRMYFLRLGDDPNSSQFALAELPDWDEKQEPSVFLPYLWPGAGKPGQPSRVDHLSFGVESRAALEWFRERLIAHGHPVSEIEESGRWHSLHFYGPNGFPLEMSAWKDDMSVKPGHFSDPNPVKALRRT